ncbi:protein kinase [Streptomyces sp. NPDC048295]|uniref:protein kinase domain-containing protein n=1 Tax=Streptomyces sp. NPDC048295 TaxID=3154617 RepID=UPI00343836A6
MSERVLSGRYRLVERLGAGGMGVVWRAEDLVLHREVAVKTVAGPGVTDEAAARLEREARAAAGLSDSPHVVTVHDFGRDGDTLFIVMALATGRPLDRVLAADGLPPLVRAVDWARQVSLALEAAHERGIVHRDIKPANVMVAPDGTVRVLDFGIAWFHPDLGLDRLSRADGVLGSAPWMSPEQARGEEISPASDLYSLGCLLYQFLTGVTPFGDRDALAQVVAHATETPDRPSAHRSGLPAELDQLVVELLAKSPGNRPASATETVARLGSVALLLGIEETTGRPPAPPAGPPAPARRPEQAKQPVKRRTVLLGALGVVAVSTTVVVVPKVLREGNGGSSGSPRTQVLKPRWKKTVTGQPALEPAGPVVLVAGDDKPVVAYDRRTGEERWRAAEDVDDTYPMTDSTLYVTAGQGGELRALDPATGTARWTFAPLGDDDVTGGAFPVLVPECVYVGLGRYVFSLDHATGDERWRYELPDGLGMVTALAKAPGILLTRNKEQAWAAIGEVDGRQLWTWDGKGRWTNPPSYVGEADGRLFFAFDDDSLTAVDATNGQALHTHKDGYGAQVIPEHKLVLSTRGNVRARSAVDGKQLWSVPNTGNPFVLGDTVVMYEVAADKKSSGTLAVDIRTGKERWRHKDLSAVFEGIRGGAQPEKHLILLVNEKHGTRLVRVDASTGARGPVCSLPDKELLSARCVGDTVYALCADRLRDPGNPDDRGPARSRLHAVALADLK